MLKKIGITFSGDDLTDFEVNYLTFIGATFNELEAQEMKKQKSKPRNR